MEYGTTKTNTTQPGVSAVDGSPIVVFVVPLKSRTVANSWARACQLCERTLRSICNQSDGAFRVIVVCNERPELSFEDERISFVTVDFAPVAVTSTRSRSIFDFHRDQAQRIERGIHEASALKPMFVMVVDADDFVSRRIVAHARKNPGCAGWYGPTGYIYREGWRLVYKKRERFFGLCGSALIIAADIARHSVSYHPTGRRYAHSSTTLAGHQFQALPFPVGMYVVGNGENFSMTLTAFQTMFSVRKIFSPSIIARRLRFNHPCLRTRKLAREFGVNPVS